jgi:hypothetical protein
VPKWVRVFDSVWSMKRKTDIKTCKVYEHKARLSVHGGQQEFTVIFFETFSPVVNWCSVRRIFTLPLLSDCISLLPIHRHLSNSTCI